MMKKTTAGYFKHIILFIPVLFFGVVSAQDSTDKPSERYEYRPHAGRMMVQDSGSEDTEVIEELAYSDSLETFSKEQLDSISIRQQFVQDSILAREQFIQDSILTRQLFVRDSILRRKQILDSLIFLSNELPNLLNASIYTLNDDIILRSNTIEVIGDSILSDFTCIKLPNRFTEPYTPWKGELNLSTYPISIDIDSLAKLIKGIDAPGMKNYFSYSKDKLQVQIKQQGLFAMKQGNRYYKAPVDSVFFTKSGQVIKVKRYYQLFAATETFQIGTLQFNFLYQVKQYSYQGDNLASYKVVKFCDRWKKSEPEKVCNIASYIVKKLGYSYELIRSNEPSNEFADGTYKYEFDNRDNLKSVTFRNIKNSENWKTFIEINEHAYVSRYVYQNKGIVNRTLLVNYFLNDPKAKNKVETVTCTFEDDGISYYQRNNTTEESRKRDRLTGEWSAWLKE